MTKAKIRVLQWILKGSAPSDIAEQLCVSRDTVRDPINKLLRKTGCGNPMKLVSTVLMILGTINEGSG